MTWPQKGAATPVTSSGSPLGVSLPTGKTLRPKPMRRRGVPLCDWQPGNGTLALTSAGAGSSISLDSTMLLLGKSTAKCVFSTVGDTFIARYTPTNPLKLNNVQQFNFPIKFTNNQTAGGVGAVATPFQIWVGLSTGGTIRFNGYFNYMQSGEWQTYSFNRNSNSLNTVSGVPFSTLDTTGVTVTYIQIVQATTAAANANTVWLGSCFCDTTVAVGRVMLRLDGEYQSQYDLIFPLLKKYNLRASLAIVWAGIGAGGGLPAMSLAQLSEMVNWGCCPMGHTYNNVSTTADGRTVGGTGGYVNAAQWPLSRDIAYDCRLMDAAFLAQGTPQWSLGVGLGVWGYTHGFDNAVADATRQKLVGDGLRSSGRIVMFKSPPYQVETSGGFLPGLNTLPVDLYNVTGALQWTNTNTAADLIACKDAAKACGGVAIITGHRVVTTSPGALEILLSDFETFLASWAADVAAGTVVDVTANELVNEFWDPYLYG